MSGAEALELHTNNLDEVVGLMADHITGVTVQDRKHLLKSFRSCFVASEAMDWLLLRLTPALRNRDEARALCAKMLARGMIRPAVEDASSHGAVWSDNNQLYRFQHEAPNADHLLLVESMTLKVGLVIRALRSHRVGLELRDRKHRLRTVKLCFLGSDFVDWLANNLNLKRSASCSIGRWMLDQSIAEPVGHDRGFVDSNEIFYRWLPKSDDPALGSLTMAVEQDSFAVGSASAIASRLLQRAASAGAISADKTTSDRTTSDRPPKLSSTTPSTPQLGRSPLRPNASATAATTAAATTAAADESDDSFKSPLGRATALGKSSGSNLSSPRSVVWSQGGSDFSTDYGSMPADVNRIAAELADGYTFKLESELGEYSVMPSVPETTSSGPDNVVSDATAGYDRVPE